MILHPPLSLVTNPAGQPDGAGTGGPTSTSGAVGGPGGHINATSAQTNQIIEALQPTLNGVRSEVLKLLAAFIGGFLFLIAAFGYGYIHIDDKLDAQAQILGGKIDTVNTRIDAVDSDLSTKINDTNDLLIQSNTKLEDLLARIPPQIQSVPTH
jgi:hypothetical protein